MIIKRIIVNAQSEPNESQRWFELMFYPGGMGIYKHYTRNGSYFMERVGGGTTLGM